MTSPPAGDPSPWVSSIRAARAVCSAAHWASNAVSPLTGEEEEHFLKEYCRLFLAWESPK